MKCYQKIVCPACGSRHIRKAGYSASGERRYRCDNPDCSTKSFMLTYRYKAYQSGMKERVVEMAHTAMEFVTLPVCLALVKPW